MQIEKLQILLQQGQDSLILRFGLAQALLKQGEARQAIEHLHKALQFDPEYSAAFKLLGKAYAQSNQAEQAIHSYQQGITVAEKNGDIQAAKEMRVFLKRLQNNPHTAG